ncbi:MAG: ribosomal-processing cysteine protease Prp [Oscillospiraceae bacterium]|nr:ribosomal-processing cysteine protease Prp [Oscillospiraceae bacterium]
MVDVLVVRDGCKAIVGFEIRGHSGYDVAGRDIVCAAVSVTAYNSAGALSELAGIAKCYVESPGFMKIGLPDEIDAERRRIADIIMNTAYIGFRQIQESYPEYLKIKEIIKEL